MKQETGDRIVELLETLVRGTLNPRLDSAPYDFPSVIAKLEEIRRVQEILIGGTMTWGDEGTTSNPEDGGLPTTSSLRNIAAKILREIAHTRAEVDAVERHMEPFRNEMEEGWKAIVAAVAITAGHLRQMEGILVAIESHTRLAADRIADPRRDETTNKLLVAIEGDTRISAARHELTNELLLAIEKNTRPVVDDRAVSPAEMAEALVLGPRKGPAVIDLSSDRAAAAFDELDPEDAPTSWSTDPALQDWIMGAVTYGGDFIKTLAQAAQRADAENYPVLRPALLQFRIKFPKYVDMCPPEDP